MTENDKNIIIDWLGDTSPKGILEDTEIQASEHEIQTYIYGLHTLMEETCL